MGGLSIRNNLKNTSQAIQVGDFKKAQLEVDQAKQTVEESKQVVSSLQILKRVGVLSNQIDQTDQLFSLVDDGIEGVRTAVSGTEALFQTTKIISGEAVEDPKPLFTKAQTDLTSSSQKISRVKASLEEPSFKKKFT